MLPGPGAARKETMMATSLVSLAQAVLTLYLSFRL
jgi:hypothetical protein